MDKNIDLKECLEIIHLLYTYIKSSNIPDISQWTLLKNPTQHPSICFKVIASPSIIQSSLGNAYTAEMPFQLIYSYSGEDESGKNWLAPADELAAFLKSDPYISINSDRYISEKFVVEEMNTQSSVDGAVTSLVMNLKFIYRKKD